jgi:UMF1 family MFS transporter
VLTIGFSRVAETARQIPRYRELAKFLLAFFVYSCGMSTIIAFSGELAFQYLGAGAIFLVFCWVLSLIAGVGSASTGFWQRRFGQRGVVGLSLVVWIATAVGAAFMPAAGSGAATWPIWLVGAGVGFGLGLTGNASRALVGVFTPAHKTAEFFGMWGLAYKLASVIGPPLYGEMFARFGQGAAMGVVAAFFAVGLALLGLVAVAPGKAAAEEAEREFASGIDDADLAAAARVSREEAESVERARTKPKG